MSARSPLPRLLASLLLGVASCSYTAWPWLSSALLSCTAWGRLSSLMVGADVTVIGSCSSSGSGSAGDMSRLPSLPRLLDS